MLAAHSRPAIYFESRTHPPRGICILKSLRANKNEVNRRLPIFNWIPSKICKCGIHINRGSAKLMHWPHCLCGCSPFHCENFVFFSIGYICSARGLLGVLAWEVLPACLERCECGFNWMICRREKLNIKLDTCTWANIAPNFLNSNYIRFSYLECNTK